MPRVGITREQVFETATTLAEEGIPPTVKLIRDKIGGSYSTITPLFAAWKDERSTTNVASIPDMPESVAAACRTLWANAWKVAQDAVKAEREGLTAARQHLEQERVELITEIDALETKCEALEAEREALARKVAEAEKGHALATNELNHFRVDNARLEERVANLSDRADELREQVRHLGGELASIAKQPVTPPASAPRKPPSA